MERVPTDDEVQAEMEAALMRVFHYECVLPATAGAEAARVRSVARRLGRKLGWRIQTLRRDLEEGIVVHVLVHEVDGANWDRMVEQRRRALRAAVEGIEGIPGEAVRHLRSVD